MQDILIVNGEVIWTGDDIFVTEGEDAIDQQAYLRATCDLGESIFYDGYGSKLFDIFGKTRYPNKQGIDRSRMYGSVEKNRREFQM